MNVDPVLYQKFLRALYKETPIIFPTRHPADLVQSWMHYSKTRANKFLIDLMTETMTAEVSERWLEYFAVLLT